MRQIAATLVCISFLFIGTGLWCFGKPLWWVHMTIAGLCAVVGLGLSLASGKRRRRGQRSAIRGQKAKARRRR